MNRVLLKRVACALLLAYAAAAVVYIAVHKQYQRDLYRYYSCAKAYEAGINPYDAEAVSQAAQNPVITFTNPPVVLFIWRALSGLDYNLLFYLYLAFKVTLLAALVVLWRNGFLGARAGPGFYILCALGFNSALYLDLLAGNITIPEQCLIWLAFFYYIKHKLPYFCAFIIAASLFKIQPIVFLGLLLFTGEDRKYRLLAGSLAVFAGIIALQYIADPALFARFVAGFNGYAGVERGIINPSVSALLRDMVDLFLKAQGPALRNAVSTSLYFIVIAPVVFVSVKVLARINSAKIEDRQTWTVLFGCTVYAVAANYFKDYSYILLLLPAYVVIKKTRISPRGLLLFIMCISAANVTFPGARALARVVWNYYPLCLAYLVWGLYLRELRGLTKK